MDVISRRVVSRTTSCAADLGPPIPARSPGVDESDGLRNLYRERVVFLFGASCLVVLAHAVDLIAAGRANWPALAVRLVWAALLVVAAEVFRKGRAPLIRRVSSVACLATALLYLALVAVTGRSESPVLPFAYVLMIILPVIVFELIAVPLVSSALLMVGTWAILLLDSVRASEMLGHAHVGLVAFAVAWMLALAHRRARESEAAQVRARREAFERLQEAHAANEKLVAELREALVNVKTLTGLLPVCSWCRRIRNDEGYWEQLEAYVQANSDAAFSHGICPECFKKRFPDES